jgi:putative flavoprotein involved in K+ transport
MELEKRPWRIGNNRRRGHQHGPIPNRSYWSEQQKRKRKSEDSLQNTHAKDTDNSEEDPHVVIIGGGQGGLALGARLSLMDIPYIILEAGPKPGSAWRNRYPSLHLHDPVWYNHMPYLPYPDSWPIFAPRDKIADWLEMYANVMDLNIQLNSRVVSVKQLPESDTKAWVIEYKQKGASAVTQRIRARNVVFATGNSSHPKVPSFKGSKNGTFRGIQLHSSKYHGGKPFKGKRVVVIGSNNSAFDVCQDLWEQGAAAVTMIQRSPGLVVSSESVLKHGLGPLYSEDAKLHHEDADLVATTMPYRLLLDRWKQVTAKMKETDADLQKSLMEAGYQFDFGPDDTGIFAKSATEGGGFYIDMGCADLIINGNISVKYATVNRLEADSVVINSKVTGEEESIAADVIIYATGFGTLDEWVADLCGKDIAKAIGRTWGLGLGKRPKDPGPWEGELRNMWKPTSVKGLWFQGGNLAQSRHYSRFLALQLAAEYEGTQATSYGMP